MFAKIFEKEDRQMLIYTTASEEDSDLRDVVQIFHLDRGGQTTVTIGGVSVEAASKFLEDFKEEEAFEIIEDPYRYLRKLSGT